MLVCETRLQVRTCGGGCFFCICTEINVFWNHVVEIIDFLEQNTQTCGHTGGSTENRTIPTYPYPRSKFCRHENVPCYPGNKKSSRHEFVWPPRGLLLLREKQTGDKPRTDEAETSTFLARVGPETVPSLRTVATPAQITNLNYLYHRF